MSNISGYQGNFNPSIPASIASGQTTSPALPCAGLSLCGIITPATFTGVALTFLVCDTLAGTYVPLYNASGPVSYTVAPSRYTAIDPKDFDGVAFLKIVSGATETGTRALICSLKGF